MAHWDRPSPLGYAAAAESEASIAAPLLAGFAVTTIGVVVATSTAFRWPGLVLLLLTTSVILLVTAVQCGFQARQFSYSRADVDDWIGTGDDSSALRENLRRSQNDDYKTWRWWARLSRVTYNGGIVVLALALAAALPPLGGGHGAQQLYRWSAAALAAAAALAEAAWITVPSFKAWMSAR